MVWRGEKMIRIGILASLLVFGCTMFAAAPTSKQHVSRALTKLKADIDSDRTSAQNPLQSYNFESFQSKSYLYYYRALGFAQIAKKSPNALLYVNKALDDVRRASEALHVDDARIEQLRVTLQKDKINLLHSKKRFGEMIPIIEQLPHKARSDAQYVLLYAEALFKTKQFSDFKRLARKYLPLLRDEKLVKAHLTTVPSWSDVLKDLPASLEITANQKEPVDANVSSEVTASLTDKKIILENPREAVDFIKNGSRFTRSKKVFGLASELYFALYRKESPSPAEKKFVGIFADNMNKFAPPFLDSLITAHWNKAETATAEKLSIVFLKKFPWHADYPKVLYNLGRIQEDSRKYQKAAETFAEFIKNTDDATYIELANFRVAWMQRFHGKFDVANELFAKYLAKYPEGRYASTSEYAQIKYRERTEGREAAIEFAKAYIKKYPLSLYAYILIDQYGLPQSLVREIFSSETALSSVRQEFSNFAADIKTLSLLRIYHELLEFGLADDAIAVLQALPQDKSNELFALFLAAEFQRHDHTAGELKNLLSVATRETPLRQLVSLKSLFPFAQQDTILQTLSSQNASIPPWLVLSLIRQESAFDPKARSSAQALGLMQLTDGAARRAAKELELKEFSLLKEEDNIKLGVHLFNSLLQKYDQRIDYALAAYNAGETPTRLWITLRGHLEPMDFIESIPFPETRTYIKSVLRNFAMYRMIYGTQDKSLVSFRLNPSIPDAPSQPPKITDEASAAH